MTISAKLLELQTAKTAIKDAITAKGQDLTGVPFTEYAGKISTIEGGGGGEPSKQWVRPSDWLPLPEVLPTDEILVGLYAIIEGSDNTATISASVNGGNSSMGYTVDWGDGSAPVAYGNNVVASYTYDYGNIPNDTKQADDNKQVIISVTPYPGKTFRWIKTNNTVTNTSNVRNWMEIVLSGSVNIGIQIGSSSISNSFLKKVTIKSGGTWSSTYTSDAFRDCFQLEELELYNEFGRGLSSFARFFMGCSKLKTIPMINTSSANDMANMFANCTNLVSVPLLITANVMSFSGMFSNCISLIEVPVLDTKNATVMNNMFYGCTNLTSVPVLDTSKVTVLSSVFYDCTNLTSVPVLDTSAATNVSNLFYNCSNLLVIPDLNFQSVTLDSNTNSMFNGCKTLSRSLLSTLSVNHTYTGSLSREALIEIFNNLPVISTAKTINVNQTHGSKTLTTEDKAIAIAKGWNVT